MIPDVYYDKVRNGLWNVYIGSKAVFQVSSKPTAERAVEQIKKNFADQAIKEDRHEDVDLIYYCNKCDEPCDWDGVWQAIKIFYCPNCDIQYEIKE